jgi:hypothetical protein
MTVTGKVRKVEMREVTVPSWALTTNEVRSRWARPHPDAVGRGAPAVTP